MSDRTPAQHVSDATEAIRAANHATLTDHPRDGWRYASDACNVAGSSAQLLIGLHQLVDQVGSTLSRACEAGLLSGDTVGGPDAPSAALDALEASRRTVYAAAIAVRLARDATARVAGTLNAEEAADELPR